MAISTRKPSISVEKMESLTIGDLHELCDATETAIEDGGGFGWLELPARKTLEDYWKGVMIIPERELIIGRIDGVVASSCQIVLPPKNNEAQSFACHLTTFFVAPWARGHGLATMMLGEVEAYSRSSGFQMVNLDVRSTQTSAIKRYESAGYTKFGTNPKYALVDGVYVSGNYYYKEIK